MSGFHADWFKLYCAGRLLRHGGVVAHATEAVWGLACVPFFESAVSRILAIKDRTVDKGLIVIIANPALAGPGLDRLEPRQRDAVLASWPGANTWILPNFGFPAWITGGRDQVALRVPGHEQARRLCEAAGGYLVSTSANVSGRPPARTEVQLRKNLSRRLDCIVSGQVAGASAPSTIRDARSNAVLRAGATS